MMQKQPVTLINKNGERHECASSSEATAFLGIKSASVITEMKRNPKKEVNGWHIEGAKVSSNALTKRNQRHRLSKDYKTSAVMAIKNYGSTDPEKPEEVLNFRSYAECARHFNTSASCLKGPSYINRRTGEKWIIRKIDTPATRKLLRAIENDNGIINLDDADNRW